MHQCSVDNSNVSVHSLHHRDMPGQARLLVERMRNDPVSKFYSCTNSKLLYN